MTEGFRNPREEELAFFAKIGADVSHEMRNILAIVGQNAGLLEDQLALARGRKVPDPEKLKRVAERIERQVGKGIEAMERFSRFAHAADESKADVDLAALVADVTVLARRHAKHLGVSFQTTLPPGPVHVTSNPFSLQHLVFSCLEMVWQCAVKEEPVGVALAGEKPAAVLTVSGAAGPDVDDLSNRRGELSIGANQLGASIETSCVDGVVALVLSLPLRSVQIE